MNQSPTHWRVRQQPRKKNTPCFLHLAGVDSFLKKERVFFFGILPSKYSGSARGFNTDEVLAKLFFGERICQNFGSFVFEFGCRKWKRRGLGRSFPFAPLFSFGEIRVGNKEKSILNFQKLLVIWLWSLVQLHQNQNYSLNLLLHI